MKQTDYKEKCEQYFDRMKYNIDDILHESNTMIEKQENEIKAYKEKGAKWFYFEYVKGGGKPHDIPYNVTTVRGA